MYGIVIGNVPINVNPSQQWTNDNLLQLRGIGVCLIPCADPATVEPPLSRPLLSHHLRAQISCGR